MNYSLAVHPDKSKEFSENDEANFAKRNKLSSKCVDQILSSDHKFESPPVCGFQRKLGLQTSVPTVVKPYSSININSNSLKLTTPNKHITNRGNLTIKCTDRENLDKLLSNCIKEGREFEETFKILECQKLIESNSLNEQNDNRKQSSAGSSDQEED